MTVLRLLDYVTELEEYSTLNATFELKYLLINDGELFLLHYAYVGWTAFLFSNFVSPTCTSRCPVTVRTIRTESVSGLVTNKELNYDVISAATL